MNQYWPDEGRSPGADDDASGTVTILEAFRSLVSANWSPVGRAVEFHWYAAEEGGLLGSQEVARHYASNNYTIVGMLQVCVYYL